MSGARRLVRTGLLGGVAVIGVTACGAPPPDLFVVERSGRGPNANLELVVSDGGRVRCGPRAESVPLDAERLLAARQLARDLAEPAALGLELPPGAGATLSYRARLEAGSVAFSDRSANRPDAFNRLVAFTTDVAERVCRLDR